MSLIRPEVAALLHRWREVIAAVVAGLAALWLMWLGGWLLTGLGVVMLVAVAGYGLTALRRLRFSRPVTAAGVVEVLEGQISYLGPHGGGWVALSELSELALVGEGERRWRLRETDGRELEIPAAAAGADQLFDVFAALPGLDARALLRALEMPAMGAQVLWLRRTGPALTWTPQGDRSSR